MYPSAKQATIIINGCSSNFWDTAFAIYRLVARTVSDALLAREPVAACRPAFAFWLCALPGSEYLAGDLVFGGAAVGEASAGPQPPCDTDRVSLLMRRACRLFPHHSDQTVHLTAVALDDGGEFGALGH